jgi:hypothetical protein
MRATRGLMEAHARHVLQESGKARQELAAAMPARKTPTRLLRALRLQTAPATRATRGLLEARARRAVQESTRRRQEQPRAAHVEKESIQQLSRPHIYRHAKVVPDTPTRLRGAQFRRAASATRATRGLLEARARRAIQESTNRRQEHPRAANV